MKNRILALALAVVLAVVGLAGCSKKESGGSVDPQGTHHAVITVKEYGQIKLELDGDTAPITVANFIKLANEGFYEGVTFHRVVPGFVIQGGDPEGTGSGGSKDTIKGEFALNGVENGISHKRGVISMARLGNDYDSASSQFFIVLDDAAIPSLDGGYAAFGWVTEGMEVVDKIAELPVVDSYSGLVDASNQPVIESVEILD